jgi:hypothetical protein
MRTASPTLAKWGTPALWDAVSPLLPGLSIEVVESIASTNAELVERLNSYDGILVKQRALAVTLCEYINKGEWDEVTRHVGLINGLSALIRDDAKAILGSLSSNGDAVADDERNFC